MRSVRMFVATALLAVSLGGCAFHAGTYVEVESTSSNVLQGGVRRVYPDNATRPVHNGERFNLPSSAGMLRLQYFVPAGSVGYVGSVQWRVDKRLVPPSDVNREFGFGNTNDGEHEITLTVSFMATGSTRIITEESFLFHVNSYDDQR